MSDPSPNPIAVTGRLFVADAAPDANHNVFTAEALSDLAVKAPWSEVGEVAADGIHVEADPDGIPIGRPHTLRQEGDALVASFALDPASEAWKIISGVVDDHEFGEFSLGPFSIAAEPATHSVDVQVVDHEPDLPPAPVKGWPHVGKKYRKARRAYGRRVRAWKRAGRPTRPVRRRFHFPRVVLDDRMPHDAIFLIPDGAFDRAAQEWQMEQRIALSIPPLPSSSPWFDLMP